MPMFVNNYRWEQNATDIRIFVPLKNVTPSKMQLFADDKFIKLNYTPYILELVLNATVVPSKTKCVIKPDEVILELAKAQPRMWETLHESLVKQQLVEVKKNTIHREQQNATAQLKEKEKRINERKQFLHDHQMQVINEQKQKIRLLQSQQKVKAYEELAVWNNDVGQANRGGFHSTENEGWKGVDIPASVPFPRNDGVISFSFSPRILPTPKRESKTAEEEEVPVTDVKIVNGRLRWLRKEAEARRATGFVPEDLTEEEKNPVWLLNKGKSFFDKENYEGAYFAFEYGSKIAPQMPVFYVELARTHLKKNCLHRAIENATLALNLLTPVCANNSQLRGEAYHIRAEAYKLIGETELSDSDLTSASNLR